MWHTQLTKFNSDERVLAVRPVQLLSSLSVLRIQSPCEDWSVLRGCSQLRSIQVGDNARTFRELCSQNFGHLITSVRLKDYIYCPNDPLHQCTNLRELVPLPRRCSLAPELPPTVYFRHLTEAVMQLRDWPFGAAIILLTRQSSLLRRR